MSSRGADWYKREPRAFLEGVRTLTERQLAVYAVVLDLIYDGGHQTLNDPKHVASYFSDLGAAAVRRVIDELVALGKLEREGDYLTNKRAKNQGKTREELRVKKADAGRLGGVQSGVSRAKPAETNDLAEATASEPTLLDKIRVEEEKKEVPRPNGLSSEPEFETWYAAFPKHVGKGQARKAYRAAQKKADAATLLAGARRAARQFAASEPQFIPHPATWLNGERWLDQTAGQPGATSPPDGRETEIYAGLR